MNVEVTWTLDGAHNFAEKRMTLTTNRDYGLKKVVLSRPTFAADGLNIVSYRYPQFGRAVGKEPNCTFFGRTSKGGFFTGIEMPFDTSLLSERQVVLAYAPSIKVKAGERIVCEPVYFGIYQRHIGDDQPNPMMLQCIEKARREFQQKNNNEVLPLQSESDAMNAMTSANLGPPRYDLVPMACGWHSEMQHGTYTSDKMVGEEMRSLDFIAECGIDWVSDSHPWGGETEKMNALGANDKYMPGELVTKFLEHALKKYDYMTYRKDLKGFGEPKEGMWDGWQRINVDTKEGGIFGVFHHGAKEDRRVVYLDDLKEDMLYSICLAPSGKKLVCATGKVLIVEGLPVNIWDLYGGNIYEVKKIK
jgi:hypothetical protein